MGHLRLGNLPRTRKWQQVIQLIDAGAGAAQTANATITAAEKGFKEAGQSAAMVQAFWRLAQLPLAARSDDFAEALVQSGINVGQAPSLLDLCAAISAGEPSRDENDLGDMARLAAAEALQKIVGNRLANFFGSAPRDLQRELARLASPSQFGSLAREFFTRLTERYLNYFISRTLPHHVGEGRRFATLAQTGDFTKALRTHCHEASRIVEDFAGEWLSKTNWKHQEVSKAATATFVDYAMQKLLSELKRGAGRDGD